MHAHYIKRLLFLRLLNYPLKSSSNATHSKKHPWIATSATLTPSSSQKDNNAINGESSNDLGCDT